MDQWIPQGPYTIWEDKDNLAFAYADLHQVPIDVTAGWTASLVGTRPPRPQASN